MKRIMSIMLAVALVLTTLALPMSAFAAEGDPVAMELVYAIDTVNDVAYENGKIFPGDTVVVSATLTATEEVTIKDLEFTNTVTNGLDGQWTVVGDIINSSSTEAIDEDILVAGGSIVVNAAGTKIMTGTFTMPNDTANYTVSGEEFTAYAPAFGDEEFSTWMENFTVKSATINVVQPVNTISVDGTPLSPDAVKTVYADSANITWSSESTLATAEYSLGEATAVTIPNEGIDVTEAGTYVITVKYGDGLVYTCSFKLSDETVDGTISTTIGLVGEATEPVVKYGIGDTFTVPVVLTAGPSTDIVGSVGFKVTYDNTYLSMAKAETDTNVLIEAEEGYDKVTYTAADATAENLLKKDETVATLTFTVKNTAVYGNTTISFAGIGLAIEGTLTETSPALGVTQESTTILVMPATLATVDKTDLSNVWTKVEYPVDVTVNAGTAKLYKAKNIDFENADVADFESWFSAEGVQDVTGSITINEYIDYVVVTKLGENPVEYQAVIIKAEETKFDITVPVVVDGEGMTEWLRTDDDAKTIEVAKFATATDSIPAEGAIKAEYYFGTPGEVVWTEAVGGIINIAKDAQDTTVTIKWTDEVGNATEAKTYALKLDATKPVINFTAPGAAVEGVKTASFTVTDAVGEVDADSIKVYTATTEITDVTELEPIELTNTEGTYSFGVSALTYYYIVASDKAGISADVVKGQITFTAATKTTMLDVKVLKPVEAVEGEEPVVIPTLKFYDTETMAAKKIYTKEKSYHDGNGTFTYVEIIAPAAQEEIITDIKVNGEEPEDLVFDTVGVYELVITNTDATSNYEATTFKFEIVEPANILTVNGNSVYDVVDYGRVRDLIGDGESATPGIDSLFFGGYYSGDLNGNGIYATDDLNELLTNLRARVKLPVNSDYPILNK